VARTGRSPANSWPTAVPRHHTPIDPGSAALDARIKKRQPRCSKLPVQFYSPGRTLTSDREVNAVDFKLDRGNYSIADIVPPLEEHRHGTDPLRTSPSHREHRSYGRCSPFGRDRGIDRIREPYGENWLALRLCYKSSGLSPVCFEILANIRGPISSP
jgi:hypothetical protein